MHKPKFKLVSIIGIAVLCLALGGQALAGDSVPQKLSMATFKSGSGWYIMAQTMAKIMLAALPKGTTVDVLPYSGGVGNPLLLHKDKANLAMGFPVETGQAIKGESPYKEKMPELRMLVGNLDTYWYLFSVRGNVPIASFEELKAKKYPLRLVVLPKGSSGEWATKTVLASYGITYADIESWGGKVTNVSFPTAVEMMKDGQADAFAHVSTPGHPSWTQLATLTNIHFLAIGAKVGAELVGKYGFRMSTLPPGAFRGVEKPVQVLGFATLLMTTDKMPEDIAYKITKAICENRDQLVATYKGAAAFRPQNAPDVPLPLHPGAKKYYKEVGYIK